MVILSLKPEERIKLDIHDKKILFYLNQDSRISRKQLAKKLKISPQSLHYKIERLEKEAINPIVLINYNLLNINQHIILVPRLSNEEKERLMENNSVIFLIQTLGKYQYIINILTNDINKFCEKYIPNYHIESYKIEKQIPDIFNPYGIENTTYNKIKEDNKIELDKKDYKILLQLCKNPLDSLIKISEETGIDRQTIKERIIRMEKANIIQKFRYAANIFKIGFLTYIIKLKIIPKNKNKILNNIRNNKYSGIVLETTEGYIQFYMPPSHNELFEFTEILQKIDNTIITEIYQASEYFKIDPNPKTALEIFEKNSN